jgi:uncharacterized protein
MRIFNVLVWCVFWLTTGRAEVYIAETLPSPNFKTNSYIIDPDDLISETNEARMLPLKETYFFKRLIEPVVIAVNSIDGHISAVLSKYAEIHDFEKKTNGRYVIQCFVADQSTVNYYAGSQLRKIYSSDFFNSLKKSYESELKNDLKGTYQFVLFQKLGAYLIDKVAFYFDLETTPNLIIPEYPNKLILANKAFETAKFHAKSISTKGLEATASNTQTSENRSKNDFAHVDYSSVKYEYADKLIRDITDVPNQRSINNIWVSNPNRIITANEANRIDQKLKEIEAKTGYEIAVVLLNSINGQDAYDFGLRLFNTWGIGKKNKNNGLLISVVLSPRALTFVTGTGTELVLSDAATFTIGEDHIKPSFKKGAYAEGLLNGLEKIQSIFEGSDVPTITSTNFTSLSDNNQNAWYERHPVLAIYVLFAFVFFVIYLVVLFVSLVFIRNLHRRYHVIKFFNLLIFPIVFPLPFLPLYYFNKLVMNRWRNTVRFGELKGEVMHKLAEDEEDEYLSKGQVTEERIKSIDYDVWVTNSRSEILILGYKDWINKYKKCPKCHHKTYFKVYDKTVKAATYSSSGSGQKKFACENCKHEKITNYVIPRLRKSNSTYSRGGSSWGGGSSWSGGGSSFGGGFSGGGGSSSSW